MKENWKGGNMLNPLPVVMVSCGDMENSNIVTVAWCGNVCTNPPILYISLRKSRYSYDMILKNKEFVVNLVTKDLAFKCDYAGVKSGKDVDKFEHLKLTKEESLYVKAPRILESPVNLECKLREVIELGSHDMFLADIVNVSVDKSLIDKNNRLKLEDANLITYSHGEYYSLGEYVGKFGYSVKKKN